jgi:hypothetical protein
MCSIINLEISSTTDISCYDVVQDLAAIVTWLRPNEINSSLHVVLGSLFEVSNLTGNISNNKGDLIREIQYIIILLVLCLK